MIYTMVASIKLFVLLNAFFLIGYSQASKLPSFISPCHIDDKNLNECMLTEGRRILKKFAQGVPELNIESMDPLKVGEVSAESNLNGNFKYVQKDAVLTGLKNSQLLDIKIDLDKKTVMVHMSGNMTSKCNYTIEGRILLFPINGKGVCISKMRGFDLHNTWNYDLYKGKDGKDHMRIVKQNLKFDYGKSQIKMTGLFSDDPFLSETMNNFLAANSDAIMKELGAPGLRAVRDRTGEIFNDFFSKVPFEELFPHS